MAEPRASALDGNDVPLESDAIQFDQAEYATPVPSDPTCSVCHRVVLDSYYEINGKVVCASCRQEVEAALRGGSRLGRLFKALILGSVAALVGAVLYYAFVRITNINFGLVAVLLGLIVGGAVRKGSGNRGGRFYQLLAVFLTYSAIAGMNVPGVIEGIQQIGRKNKEANAVSNKEQRPAEKAVPEHRGPAIAKNAPSRFDADLPANPFADAPADATTTKVAKAPGQSVPPDDDEPEPDMRASTILIGLTLLLALFYVFPILLSFESPISGLIYGFALWEAWKMNRRVKVSFNGPFRVSTKGSNEGEPEVDDHGG